MSGAPASASGDAQHKTRDLEDALAQVATQPPPDARTRAFTAPTPLDNYVRPDPGYPTPSGVGGVTSLPPPPYPYNPPPPAYPQLYPAVGFNTGPPGQPQAYPVYPLPSNQAGFSQGYPPQVAYPTAPPPQGAFPVSGMSHCIQGTPHPVSQTPPSIGHLFVISDRQLGLLERQTHICACMCHPAHTYRV